MPRSLSNFGTRAAALAWALVFLAVLAAGLARFSPSVVRTDITDLLPEQSRDTEAGLLLSHMAAASARDVWVLVFHPDQSKALAARRAALESLRQSGLEAADPAEGVNPSAITRALLPWREHFLTEADRAWLQRLETLKKADADRMISTRAARLLYRPIAPSGWSAADDPLGFFENWLLSQTESSHFSRRAGHSIVRTPLGVEWFVLQARSSEALAAVDSSRTAAAIDTAREAAEAAAGPGVEVLAAGIPLISEAAAQRASREASFIGALSMAGIAALVLLFFARLAPLLQTAAVLLVSVAFAAAATLVVFGEIHVITIVFGATLLGICVDYVFHLLCAAAQNHTGLEARRLLLRPLAASLISTLAGYGIMMLTPMPGLRQAGVFCIAGLLATFASVMLWMAPLTAAVAVEKTPRFARSFSCWFAGLPRVASRRGRVLLALLLAVLCATGLPQFKTTNELRLISGADPVLLARQALVSSILNPTSPSQFFVVQGADDCAVLERIEALRKRLADPAAAGGAAIVAPERFLAPCSRQQEAFAGIQAANARARTALEELLGERLTPAPSNPLPLRYADWRQIVPETLSRTWVGPGRAVVLISNVTAGNVKALARAARGLDGVQFVDVTENIAASLAGLRDSVLQALAMASGAIALVLLVFFRRAFLRLWLPGAAGILAALALMGWLGIALSLFSVLPMILVLGLGADYAILLAGERTETASRSVFLAASSTLLAFGLLAFSATPALRIFGLALALALLSVLILTILLRPASRQA